MIDSEFVTVVIATFQREQELKRALSSLLEQTYQYIEVIVVDDNVDNKWNDVVKQIVLQISHFFEEKNNKCYYVKNNGRHGPGGARNCGINLATGKYVTFLDDDDLYLPSKIDAQVTALSNSNCDFSLMNSLLYNEDNKLVSKTNRIESSNLTGTDLMKYHLLYNLTNPNTMMFKTEAIRSIGGFEDLSIGEEYYLIEKAILSGLTYCYVDEYATVSYIHSKKQSLSSGKAKISGENALFNHKKTFFDILNISERKYLVVRHNAVNAYTYLRMKKYMHFFLIALKCFFVSPKMSFKVLKNKQGN